MSPTDFWTAIESPNQPRVLTPKLRWKLIALLAKAGPSGMTRTDIGKTVNYRDRAALLGELDRMGTLLDREDSKYRLADVIVNAIHAINPDAVASFADANGTSVLCPDPVPECISDSEGYRLPASVPAAAGFWS